MLRAACARHVTKMEFSDVMAGLGVDLLAAAWDTDSDLDDVVVQAETEHTPAPAAEEDLDELIPLEDEQACPVPNCTTEGPHDHDRWTEQQPDNASSEGAKGEPAEPETPDSDPMTWDSEKWLEVLAATGLRQVTVLKEARRLAEGQGAALPNSLDDLEGTPLAAQLAARLQQLAS